MMFLSEEARFRWTSAQEGSLEIYIKLIKAYEYQGNLFYATDIYWKILITVKAPSFQMESLRVFLWDDLDIGPDIEMLVQI